MAFVNIPGQSWRSPVATQADLPTAGNALGDARTVEDTSQIYIWSGSAWVSSSGGTTAEWGGITGNLEDQEDLQDALDLKANLDSPEFETQISSPIVYIPSYTSWPPENKISFSEPTIGRLDQDVEYVAIPPYGTNVSIVQLAGVDGSTDPTTADLQLPFVKDYKSNNDGVLVGANFTAFTTDVQPSSFLNTKSMSFDNGIPQYVNMGNPGSLGFNKNQAFSFGCWFKTSNTTDYLSIISKLDSDFPYTGYELILIGPGEGRVLRFQMVDDQSAFCTFDSVTTGLDDGQWHFVFGTYDGSGAGSGMKLYIDGVLDGSLTNDNTWDGDITNSINFQIGRRGGANPGNSAPFEGSIDEVSVWTDIALSAGEVSEIYNSGSPTDLTTHSQYASLLSWYRMGDLDDGMAVITIQLGDPLAGNDTADDVVAALDDYETANPGTLSTVVTYSVTGTGSDPQTAHSAIFLQENFREIGFIAAFSDGDSDNNEFDIGFIEADGTSHALLSAYRGNLDITAPDDAGILSLRSGDSTANDAGTLNILSGSSDAGTAGIINIISGTSNGEDGGPINITGGVSNAPGGWGGGVILIQGGSGTQADGYGGQVQLVGGAGEAGNTNGASIQINGGSWDALQQGGNALLTGGSSNDGNGGSVSIFAGGAVGSQASNGNGGTITINAGGVEIGDGNGGSVLIQAGGAAEDGDGGNVTIQAGQSAGAGNNGHIILGEPATTEEHEINTALGTNGVDILTLLNGPAGTAGNPTGYIQIKVNGATAYIPFWS